MKAIGESRSKQEEDKIITNEVAALKATIGQPSIDPKQMKEMIIRGIYVEMLGHDCSLAYIHAVKLANEKHLIAKRIGYLGCNLFIHKDHEFMLLLINTLQRDLKSTNHLEVCAALVSVCRLINVEMIPAILPCVSQLLSHNHEAVRKKAIMALHRFYLLDPGTISDAKEAIRKILCDPDPSVMGASLHILCDMAKSSPASCKDLVPSFISILKQVVEHRLPRDFDYHRVPAPWIQIKLLCILGYLGHADQKTSQLMYDVLRDIMQRSDTGVNVGYAIIYECVKTITKIYPHDALLELASNNISKFISSENHNLKYLGVTGLAAIVQMNPKYAAPHQMVVVDCLEDPDETLKRKTLDLLYKMTNPLNCTVVADKLLFHLRVGVDAHLRQELVHRVTTLAERYAPNNEWYLNTMNETFELGGDLIQPSVSHNLMRFIAEGTGEDDAKDEEFRRFAVNTYVKLLEKKNVLPDVLIQVIAWVLGEYASLCTVDGYTVEDIVDNLCECLEVYYVPTTNLDINSNEEDSATNSRAVSFNTTRSFLVSALQKLMAFLAKDFSNVKEIISKYKNSRSTELQQLSYEFERLLRAPQLMKHVLPYDAACEDVEIPPNFLKGYVDKALANGAPPYNRSLVMSKHMNEDEAYNNNHSSTTSKTKEDEGFAAGLNFKPYEMPKAPSAGLQQQPAVSERTPSQSSRPPPPPAPDSKTNLNVKTRAWGRDGFSGNSAKPKQAVNSPTSRTSGVDDFLKPEGNHNTSTVTSITTTSSAVQPNGKPVEQQPRELSEKEKVAAALFSGVGAAPSPAAPMAPAHTSTSMTNNNTRSRGMSGGTTASTFSNNKPVEPTTNKIPPPSADLLDLGNTPAAPPVVLEQTQKPNTSSLDDDLLFGTIAKESADTAATSNTKASWADDLLSLDMGNTTTTSSPVVDHFLQPLQISIDEVGAQWGTLPHEQTVSTQTNAMNCEGLVQNLTQSLNVGLVQIIGDEAICAGKANHNKLFVHAKMEGRNVDVLLRSDCLDALSKAGQVIGSSSL